AKSGQKIPQSRYRSYRGTIIDALGRIGDKRATPVLVALLKDKDPRSSYVLTALGRIGDKAAVDALIEAIKGKDTSFHRPAVSALGNVRREKRVVDALLAATKYKDRYVRQEAAMSLAKLAPDKALEPYVAAMKDPSSDSRSTRHMLAVAIEKSKKKDLIEALIVVLYGPDHETSVRVYAASELGRFGDKRAIAALKKPPVDDRRVTASAKSALRRLQAAARP
ncbi:MAG: HEAT repeat domain-containing protein, partial [Phycisphaerae bacterium]|nr:HEAT repeat domain-containing protein [Phycisphaerae bacterium]